MPKMRRGFEFNYKIKSMRKLNYFVKKDLRIKKVYNYAKKKYNKANLFQHNWEHILRVLYRALIIAETEKDINYSILIPAVLLHDIGVTEDEYKKHKEIGALIARRDLPKFCYKDNEIDEICYCIELHEEKINQKTIEAKILFDADRLEKSGIGGIFSFYRAQQELNVSLDRWIERAIRRAKKFIKEGFYTKKAKEMCKNGFQSRLRHFKEVASDFKKRKDFLISEKDLWR